MCKLLWTKASAKWVNINVDAHNDDYVDCNKTFILFLGNGSLYKLWQANMNTKITFPRTCHNKRFLLLVILCIYMSSYAAVLKKNL